MCGEINCSNKFIAWSNVLNTAVRDQLRLRANSVIRAKIVNQTGLY